MATLAFDGRQEKAGLRNYPAFWFRLTVGLWAACILMVGAVPFLAGASPPIAAALGWTGLCLATAVALSVGLALWVASVDRLHWTAQTLLLLAAAVAAGLILAIVDHGGRMYILELGGPLFRRPVLEAISASFIIYIWIFSLYVSVMKLLLISERTRERDAEIARARAAAGRAELSALRYQIQPDVLFTTLGTACDLVETGRDEDARVLVDRLSGFMRGQLAGDVEGGGTLGGEFEALDDYVALERLRTEMAIELTVAASEQIEALPGPTLLLQPLVERRIRDAAAAQRKSLALRIEAHRSDRLLSLIIRDDGPLPDEAGYAELLNRLRRLAGAGVQLQIIYGERAALRLSLPLQ